MTVMPFVIVTKPSDGGEEPVRTEIAGAILRIGHDQHCELVLPNASAAAEQAVIQEINGAYILRHVSERGQTFVNDKPVKEALLTKKGTIRIGMVYLWFSRPTPQSPLTIERRPMDDMDRTMHIAAKTLVLDVSPIAGLAPQAGSDATQKLAPVDPEATQKLEPMSEKTVEDPGKTLPLAPRKRKKESG